MGIPRRTLRELAAIHRREPACRDVIVEGPSDQSLIDWFFAENNLAGVVVYEVGSFEIEKDRLLARGLEDNNRGRVVTLAYELEAEIAADASLTCVADSDFDIILKKSETCSLLLLTDYSCTEMYAFNARTIGKYLRLNLRHFPKDAAKVITEITSALEQLFLVRLFNFVLALKLEAVNWESSLRMRSGPIELDLDDYLTRYLNKNRRARDKERFLAEYSSRRKQLLPEPRNQINGHDFLELLSWYIHKHRGFPKKIDSGTLGREIFACLEVQHLAKELLFQRLLNRLGARPR